MSKGGFRWGRRRPSVEDCHSLSAWGHFQWAQTRADESFKCNWYENENGLLVLHSTVDGHEYTQLIWLTDTPCHYGGFRFWFVCPECGRRVGKLYQPVNLYCGDRRVSVWLCRHCYGLTYEQRRTGKNCGYLAYRTERMRAMFDRCGITTDDQDYFHKPKGMRYETFKRLTDGYNALVERENIAWLTGFVDAVKRYL